jgi:hypothetical protein
VDGLDANGADDLETALKLRGVPSISDTPKDAILSKILPTESYIQKLYCSKTQSYLGLVSGIV